MSWKIRHEGSPRAIDVASLQQVVEGMQDGLWEPTDEVMGPQDQAWIAIENHPQLAEVAADLEPPPTAEHDDETRLDMNPLIDVALVLLIFFILTTSYAALQRLIEMPKVADNKDPSKVVVVPRDKLQKITIWVQVRKENDQPVFRVEDKVVDEKDLSEEIAKHVKAGNKSEMLLDAKGVEWGTVVMVQDEAKKAGVLRAHFLTNPK
jgi:biopolymer transport protein ExbD